MKVVDASGVAALAFAETEGRRVREAIVGHDLAAPRLLPFELTNIARNKMRVRPDAVETLAEQLQDGLRLRVALFDVDFVEVFALAAARNLSAYDASYLWLARHLGAELVTLDKKLAAAAQR